MVFTLLQSSAPGQSPDAAALAGMIGLMAVVLVIGLLVGVAINVVICLLITNAYKNVPAEHQKMSPGQIWLLLIPLFNLVWNFIVYQRIPESFQSALAARGRTDVGDCGKQIGLWYSICAACTLIPCVNYVAGPAALVLLILFLVKIYDLKSKLIAPMTPAPPPMIPFTPALTVALP